ncbi:MAG: hypothetical protein ACRDT6_23885 [Micromonosporaceae bacterium]
MIIPKRFNGPPDSGNGGYTAGLVAGQLAAPRDGGAAEVTLRVPPPLETELSVISDNGGVVARDGETVVATARSTTVSELVPAVSYEEATEVSRGYPGFLAHPFPTCYSCGPERDDGLRLFPGRLPDGRTAAPLLVPDDVTTATVWAALDCPGGWTIGIEARPYVLGRIAARVDAVPTKGTRCVVTACLLEAEGRKAHVASTLWPADGGEPYATARATWIALR